MSKKKAPSKEEKLLAKVREWVPDFMRQDEKKRNLFYLVKRNLSNLITDGKRRKLLEDDIDYALLTALLHEAADVIGGGLLDKWKPPTNGSKT